MAKINSGKAPLMLKGLNVVCSPHVSLLTKKYVCHQSDGVAVLVDISRQIVIGFWFLSGLGLCSSSQRIASL